MPRLCHRSRRHIDLCAPIYCFFDTRLRPVSIVKFGLIPEKSVVIVNITNPPIVRIAKRGLAPVSEFKLAIDCDRRSSVNHRLKGMNCNDVVTGMQIGGDVAQNSRSLTHSDHRRPPHVLAVDEYLKFVVPHYLQPCARGWLRYVP